MKSLNAIICITFFSGVAFAQAGALDCSFAGDGVATMPFGSLYATANSIALTPNGDIIVSGYTSDPLGSALVKYHDNGILDSGFGNNGIVSNDTLWMRSIGLQNDGKIVVAGDYYTQICAVRYNDSGEVDSSFGTNGFFWAEGNEATIAISPDGKIVLAGYIGNLPNYDFIVLRLESNGTIDSTFGVGGVVVTDIGNSNNQPTSIAFQQDDKIVVSGYSYSSPFVDTGYISIVRYNNDGSLDSSFGDNGKAVGLNSSTSLYVGSIALQADGKILVPASHGQTYVVRFNSSGGIDSSFNNNGIFYLVMGQGSGASVVLVQPDGKILFGGGASIYPNSFAVLGRLKDNGVPDSLFGLMGIVTALMEGSYAYLNDMTLQSDGKILIAGGSSQWVDTILTPSFAVARFINDLNIGISDFSSSKSSILIYPNPIQETEVLKYSLTKDEILTLSLYDVNGKLMKNFFTNKTRTTGEQHEELNFGNLAAGNYLLTLSNGAQQVSVKMVKQ